MHPRQALEFSGLDQQHGLASCADFMSAAFHIGTAAHDADDRIVYDPATGTLTYDSNGNAGGGATQFATLDTGLALTNADFFVV
jgi:Ca2+-binding RTX toxin-like protein